MTFLLARAAMDRAKKAFRAKNPKTLSVRRLDDLLGEIDLDVANALSTAEKHSFWRGIARLADADPMPRPEKFHAMIRRYVTRKNDRWMLWALGEIEDLPRIRLTDVYGDGASWRENLPRLVAEKLVNEDKWDKLIAKVNPELRAELLFWRRDTRTMRTRSDNFAAMNPADAGPSAPSAVPAGVARLVDIGFGAGGIRQEMAEMGYRAARLLGWGDVQNPVTRTISTRFPAPDGSTTPGRPRSVEGWVTLGHPPRSPVDKELQRRVVAEFLAEHPDFRYAWNTERQVRRTYDLDAQRYIDDNAPPDLDFANPDHNQYWSYADWHGSHLGAHSFGFDTSRENVIPLPGRINVSYMGSYESVVKDLFHRFGGKLYLKVEVLEYDANGWARVVQYQAFTPDETGMPIRVMNESFVTNYAPTLNRAEKARLVDQAWREGARWRDPPAPEPGP